MFALDTHPLFFPALWRLLIVVGIAICNEIFNVNGNVKIIHTTPGAIWSAFILCTLLCIGIGQYAVISLVFVCLLYVMYHIVSVIQWPKSYAVLAIISVILSTSIATFVPKMFYIIPILLFVCSLLPLLWLPRSKTLLEHTFSYLFVTFWWVFLGVHLILMTGNQDYLLLTSMLVSFIGHVTLRILQNIDRFSLSRIGTYGVSFFVYFIGTVIALHMLGFAFEGMLSLQVTLALSTLVGALLFISMECLYVFNSVYPTPKESKKFIEPMITMLSGTMFCAAGIVYYFFV